MTSDGRDKGSHRIPIRFTDDEVESAESASADMDTIDPDNELEDELSEGEDMSFEDDLTAADPG